MAHHVCPWWLGYFLASPIRKLAENPDRLLSGLILPGMTVLDAGCAMGFFTLPAAQMTGPTGRVIAVDLQPKMINALKRRAKRRGLLDRIETRVCSGNSLGIDDLANQVDLALAIHVVHEVPDRDGFMTQLFRVTRSGGRLLVIEPKGHVNADEFAETVKAAEGSGFQAADTSLPKRGHGRLFSKSV